MNWLWSVIGKAIGVQLDRGSVGSTVYSTSHGNRIRSGDGRQPVLADKE